MSEAKPHLRTEERSELKQTKARLLRDDGETEIQFIGLDLSTQGLGVLIRGSASPGETLRLVADRVGEIALQVVWSRKDLIRQSYCHVGLKAADPKSDLRGFFTKVFVSEEIEPETFATSEATTPIGDDVITAALQALNTDDPSIFKKANLVHLASGARAFPFVYKDEQFAIVVPTSVNTNMLRGATIEQASQHVKLFKLTKLTDGSNTFRAKLAWPQVSGSSSGPILIVEDDEDLLELMKGFLEKNGFAVLEAADGQNGLSVLKRHPEISAIITDINMPGMTGLDLIQQAKKELQARGGCPPFIIVSGYVTPDVLKVGKKLGVSHWFVKPVETADLLSALGSLLAAKVA